MGRGRGRLAELGPLLDEPHTRQLDGKLRELRFYLTGRATRIRYWIAPGRRVIRRATEAMRRCVAEGHLAEDEEE